MIRYGSGSRKWTMAHGQLLGMGGITTVDPAFEDDDSEDPDGQVLSFEQYKQLTASTEDTRFKLPKIPASDIKDRSKGDFLSKLIAILYIFWWYKPLGVQEPVRIYFKSEAKAGESRSEVADETSEISASDVISKVGKDLRQVVVDIIFGFLGNPCEDGLWAGLFMFFIGIPFYLFVLCTL